jgi:hypothetical protein
MKLLPRRTSWIALAGLLALFGVSRGFARDTKDAKQAPDAKKAAEEKELEAEVKTNLAKLSAEDRKLAETQRWCAIDDENRLGCMGPPVKVMLKGQPVFLCCGGCRKQALAEPDATLTKVKELKAKAEKAKGAKAKDDKVKE